MSNEPQFTGETRGRILTTNSECHGHMHLRVSIWTAYSVKKSMQLGIQHDRCWIQCRINLQTRYFRVWQFTKLNSLDISVGTTSMIMSTQITLQHLETSIRQVFIEILPDMGEMLVICHLKLQRVIETLKGDLFQKHSCEPKYYFLILLLCNWQRQANSQCGLEFVVKPSPHTLHTSNRTKY